MTEFNKDNFKAHTVFESSFYRAAFCMSDNAILTGFLIQWLKHFVVPTLTCKVITVKAIYLEVLLVYGQPLGLLPTIISCLQRGLRDMITQFLKVEKVKEKDNNLIYKIPNPQIDQSYAYLMAWFVLYYPELMTSS